MTQMSAAFNDVIQYGIRVAAELVTLMLVLVGIANKTSINRLIKLRHLCFMHLVGRTITTKFDVISAI